jgi:hypothetical protein
MTAAAASPGPGRSPVEVATKPIWRIRLTRGLPRYLLYLACLAGLLASARFAIAPPSARPQTARATTGYQPDLAREGFASLFARRYLTWNSSEPQQRGLEASELGRGTEPVDLRPPASGAQRVLWTQVVQARIAQPGVRVYTVAAETDAEGLVYLTVPVARLADGRVALAGYPAFVGPPAAGAAQLGEPRRELADPTLSLVVSRALRNYLADSADELSADLTSTARVSLPTRPLSLESVERASWTAGGRTVLAIVRAADQHGVEYTLGYELDVSQVQGRWEVAAVQMDPIA